MTAKLACLMIALCALPGLALADGAQLYADNCVACHRPNGLGVKGAFPALAGSVVATGEPKAAALKVLNGRGGMPAFKAALTDDDIAQVLTYVRATWGNRAPRVKPATVAAARGGGQGVTVGGGQQAH